MAVRLSKVSQLHAACGAGDLETVQAFVSNQKSEFVGGKRVMIFHLDPEGASPLALAAMGGHTELAALILGIKVPPKSNAHVNGQSLSGASPLMLAAQHGHLEMSSRCCRQGLRSSSSTRLARQHSTTPRVTATRIRAAR